MLLKDHWYAACPSVRLAENELLPIQVGDIDLVVYRDRNGAARALLDRCGHRGVPLSQGRITDGNLACGYHGWQYDGSGTLLHVPGVVPGAKLPACRIPSFEAADKDDYVWVWIPGEFEQPTYRPGMSVLGDIGGIWVQKTEVWDVSIIDAVENQLDFAHTPFSHPGTYPGHETEKGTAPPLRELSVESRLSSTSVDAFSPPATKQSDPVPHWRDLSAWARFELPFRNYVFLVYDGTLAVYNWVPLSGDRCRLEFMSRPAFLNPEDPKGGASDGVKQVGYFDAEIELLTQDRVLLEGAKRRAAASGRNDYVSVETDLPQLQARKIYKAAVNGSLPDRAERRTFSVLV